MKQVLLTIGAIMATTVLASKSDDELSFVFEVVRHGARAPL